MSSIELPAGSHYALTPSIPDHYAGMTASMLQRSRAFVIHGGVEVTILTYEHRTDYDDVRRRLRDRGAMIDGVHLLNMWEDLRARDDSGLVGAKFHGDAADTFRPLDPHESDDGSLVRGLRDDAGQVLQVDYLRPDGSVLVSERRHGVGMGSRMFTLCDSQNRPVGSWPWISGLVGFWLDSLPRDPVAWMIVDSKTSADVVLRYRRPDVVKLHMVRGSHLSRGVDGPMSKLASTRQRVMENLSEWDAVVFLTATQRDDVETRFGPQPNLAVIPNSRNMPAQLPNERRRPGRGVMLASLDSRKQIDHAIRAMAMVKARRSSSRVRLDIWGQGELKAKLAKLIKKLHAPVRLRGHRPDAAEEFSQASFSLLTSRSEAFGNVLIESMGRGCIPISYDMPYGPSDIITDGVDGFLVPLGDEEALADRIQAVVTAKRSDLQPMREAGYQRALEFSDEQAVERWRRVMADAAERRGL